MHSVRSLWMTCVLGAIIGLACMQPAVAEDGPNVEVEVTATPEATSTYIWSIDKWADRSTLTVEYGDEKPVNYTVTLDVCCADDEYAVSGNIFITNQGPGSVNVNDVAVTVSPDIPGSADCGVSLPYELDELETLTCSYTAVLPDDSARTVQADVTVNGVPGFTGSEGFNFTGVTPEERDECVDVVDDWEGYLGMVCVEDVPETFPYTRMIGGCEVCGYRAVVNHVYFTTNDTEFTACATWTVCVLTPCEDGCTRTFGYWKTHSEYGPAPYDATWAELPDGADTTFFLSGQSYYQVLWTPPKKGNAYYILAHQWIAAQLNVLSGAEIPPDVLNAWLEAQELFETYTPYDIGALKSLRIASSPRSRVMRAASSADLRGQFIELAEILDAYNNGYIGPGHCPD